MNTFVSLHGDILSLCIIFHIKLLNRLFLHMKKYHAKLENEAIKIYGIRLKFNNLNEQKGQ